MESAWPSVPCFKIYTLWPHFIKTHKSRFTMDTVMIFGGINLFLLI